jgi:hypothetical protein
MNGVCFPRQIVGQLCAMRQAGNACAGAEHEFARPLAYRVGRRLMRNRCLYMVALQTELWRRGVLGWGAGERTNMASEH